MTFEDLEPGNQISLTISNERGKMNVTELRFSQK